MGVDSSGPNEPLLAEGPDLPKEMGNLGGSDLGMARLASSRYSQPYSLGGRNDAASDYQSTVASFYIKQNQHRFVRSKYK